MTTPFDVAVLVGSLRKGSITRKVARALMAAAPATLKCRLVGLDMPLYNEDGEAAPPPAWTQFRQDMAGADAVLFATPEYNRSLPGNLKNAVDIGSRPYGKGIWNGKPGAIVSVSPGKIGGLGANMALRQTLVFVDVPVMQQPEAYIGGAAELFGDDGSVKNPDTAKFLTAYMAAFAAWVAKLAPGHA
jgi:chromate reductase, NAD(P)H dehydrogenase (quinone)